MALDEVARHELHQRLRGPLGTEAAGTLMSLLPPVGWADVATTHDLDQFEGRVDQRFVTLHAVMDGRFAVVDQRFVAMDRRLDGIDRRLDGIDGRLDAMDRRLGGLPTIFDQRFEEFGALLGARIDAARFELLAGFRGELNATIASQTRLMIFSMVGTVLSLGGLALGLARLV